MMGKYELLARHPEVLAEDSSDTNFEERARLEQAALTAQMRKAAATALIELGGTMPDVWVPARERPWAKC